MKHAISPEFHALRASIKNVLLHPASVEWSIQGFGFIRTYLGDSKRWRLNVWDVGLATNASTIHDHPWAFTSWIISGRFFNQRYDVVPTPRDGIHAPTHTWMKLHTGIGGGPTPEGGYISLAPLALEPYWPGDTYQQAADEVHESWYNSGTVTLNERIGDTEHARVFWPYGQEWRDAMPRKATLREIVNTTENALSQWSDAV